MAERFVFTLSAVNRERLECMQEYLKEQGTPAKFVGLINLSIAEYKKKFIHDNKDYEQFKNNWNPKK